MSPVFDWSVLDACRHQLAAGEAAAAVERLRQLRQEYPEPAIATVLADALFQQGQPQEALACLQADIDQGVDNHWTHYSLGSLLALLGRVEAAAAAFRQSHAHQGWFQSLERGYTLSHDYFSGHIPQWGQFFEEVILQAPIRILEIGSWQGGSSLWLLDHVLGPRGGVLHCVDTWGGSSEHGFLAELGITIEELFDANIARNPHGALVEKKKGPSEEVLPGLEPHSYDLIYIDGAHEASYAIQDAIHAHRLVRPGGFLLFDDYHFQFADPSQNTARAVDFFVDTFHASYSVVHKGAQVLLQRLVPSASPQQLAEAQAQLAEAQAQALLAQAEALVATAGPLDSRVLALLLQAFDLAPDPVADRLWLRLEQPLEGDTTLAALQNWLAGSAAFEALPRHPELFRLLALRLAQLRQAEPEGSRAHALAATLLEQVARYRCQAVFHPLLPPLEANQRQEIEARPQLNDLSFDWIPLAGQFSHALQAILRSGRTPLLLDAGSRGGDSALWLARRWAEVQVVAVVTGAEEEAQVAAATAGSGVQRLLAQPSGSAGFCSPPEGAWSLLWPLESFEQLFPPATYTPALLHLDAGWEGFEQLFSDGGGWLARFPLVLIDGGLAADPQGRTLPQPYHQPLAAAGFEVVRSGSVLVAFQRPKLVELAATDLLATAHPAAAGGAPQALPALAGGLVVEPAVVAFDGEWQYPAITEQRAFQRARERLPALADAVYVGFPWASLIDHLNNGTARGGALLQALDQLLPHLEGRRRRVTVCQQIFFQQHRWLLERAGITDVFWPHATIFDSVPGLRIHPFPLYPVQWQAPSGDAPERDVLYSFIGAKATPLYLSNSRDLILRSLAGLPGALIGGNDGWFYEDLVYGVQIRGEIAADDPRAKGKGPPEQAQRYIESLRRSLFCLCPSGTGPNTIRLWEAIGSGAIPVILSDTWKPPGPRQLWEEAAFFLPDNAEGVLAIPKLTQQWAADPSLLASKRSAMLRLWDRYGPQTFITDIEELFAPDAVAYRG